MPFILPVINTEKKKSATKANFTNFTLYHHSFPTETCFRGRKKKERKTSVNHSMVFNF